MFLAGDVSARHLEGEWKVSVRFASGRPAAVFVPQGWNVTQQPETIGDMGGRRRKRGNELAS